MAPALPFAPPVRLVRGPSSPTSDCSEALKLQDLVAPRSPGKEQVLEAELPRLERLAEAQLTSCQVLLSSTRGATEVLSAAGSGLQKEAASARQALEASFFVEQDVRQVNNPEDSRVMESGRCLLAVCEGLGDLLIRLAACLTGDVMVPLQDLQRSVQARREQQRLELEKLEQYEAVCQQTLSESFLRKDKVSLELQDHLQEREGKSRSRSHRAMRWIMKKTNPKSESKLHHAAHVQTAAVEELAMRVDQVVLARMTRDQGAEALCKFLQELSSSRCGVIKASLNRCAQAWDDGGASLHALASRLQAATFSKPREAHATLPNARAGQSVADPEADCETIPSGGNQQLRSAADSPSATSAKRAREMVPPLKLGLLQQEQSCQQSVACDSPSSASSETSGEDCKRMISFGADSGEVSMTVVQAKEGLSTVHAEPVPKSGDVSQHDKDFNRFGDSGVMVRLEAATPETVPATESSMLSLGGPESMETSIGSDTLPATTADGVGIVHAKSELPSSEAEPSHLAREIMSDGSADGGRGALSAQAFEAEDLIASPASPAKSSTSNSSFVSEVVSLSPQNSATVKLS